MIVPSMCFAIKNRKVFHVIAWIAAQGGRELRRGGGAATWAGSR